MAKQQTEKFDTLSAFLRSRVEDHGGLKTLFLEYTDQEILSVMGTKEAINAIGMKETINVIGTNEILKNLDLEIIKSYLKKIQSEKNRDLSECS